MRLSMRRLFSITAILTLMYPITSPLLATCPHMQHVLACHRVQQAQTEHHCDPTMDQHQADPQSPDPAARAVKAGTSGDSCPMGCCTARHITGAAGIATGSSLPQPLLTNHNRPFLTVVFVTVGFSSNTDRGPPAA